MTTTFAQARVITIRAQAISHAAQSAGLPPIDVQQGEPRVMEEVRDGETVEHVLVDLEITFAPIRLDTYQLVGWKSATSVTACLGEDPNQLLGRAPTCDHCPDHAVHEGLWVVRKVDEPDETFQVGQLCVREAFAHVGEPLERRLEFGRRAGELLTGFGSGSAPLAWVEVSPGQSTAALDSSPNRWGPTALAAAAMTSLIALLWPRQSSPPLPPTPARLALSPATPTPERPRLAWQPASSTARPATPSNLDAARSDLFDLLTLWRHAGSRRAQEAILDRIRELGAEGRMAMLTLLSDSAHPLLLDTLQVAQRLDLTAALPLVARMTEAGDASLRAAAGACARDLERSHRRKSTLAGTIKGTGDHAGLGQDADFLHHVTSDAELLAICQSIRREANETLRITAIKALAPHTDRPLAADMLADLLDDASGAVRTTALRAFADHPQEDPTSATAAGTRHALLRVANDHHRPLLERAGALQALERGAAIPTAQLFVLSSRLEPALRVLCARCLVVAGDRRGLRIAIDILGNGASPSSSVAREAHRVLVAAAGTDLGPTGAHWVAWEADLTSLRALELPPAGPLP